MMTCYHGIKPPPTSSVAACKQPIHVVAELCHFARVKLLSIGVPALPALVSQKSNSKYGNEHEAIAVYSMMRGVEKFCPIYTLCIGNAFGEAALLLAAGSKVRQLQGTHQHQHYWVCVGWLLMSQ